MTAVPSNFRPGAFAGVADDYLRYRLPYPDPLLDEMLTRAQLPAAGARLIDLACGPGRLTFAIAGRFGDVLAVDQEPQMIAAAQAEALRRGVTHIRWRIGQVEDLDAEEGAFDLVTAAEAFHRFDQARVAALAYGWLKPGGAFATMGYGSFTGGDAPWRRVLADVVRAYVGDPVQRLQGSPNPTLAEARADELAVFRGEGFFVEVDDRDFEVSHEWTLEALLGNLRSTSVLSRAALGESHAAFEADLAAALRRFDPAERYAERLSCGYTLVRKR